MNYYLRAFKKYFVFEGRDNRPQYWYFFLFSVLVSIILYFIDSLILETEFLGNLYYLAVLVPSLAIIIRRLHDTGRSGWWVLIAFIPIIGTIWLIVLLATKGESGANKYGPGVQASSPVDSN